MSVTDEDVIGMVRATSKLYVLAVLDELTTATAVYLAAIKDVRRRYLDELGGDEPFRMLQAAADLRWPDASDWPRTQPAGVTTAGPGTA